MELSIALDNEAFRDESELVRILRRAATDFEQHGYGVGTYLKLRDLNGNAVGRAEITDRKGETMTMTQQHFNAITEQLKQERKRIEDGGGAKDGPAMVTLNRVVVRMADVCENFCTRFDRERFLDASCYP